MIVSVSRRTDIPRYYFDWFLNRLQAGYVLVPNPMNPHRISKITLSPDVVDFIVFWTKNPAPMLDKLHLLAPYPYYVQFTLNPYENDIEAFLPSKKELIGTFQNLSDKIGPDRMVWRYSPVLLNAKYTEAVHKEMFADFARRLKGYTRYCKVSFIDIYAKIKKTMQSFGIEDISEPKKLELIRYFVQIAEENGMELSACGNIDLEKAGLPKTGCIDKRLIERITAKSFRLKKDPNQRTDCYCAASVDVGTYNTCLNGCKYCYANVSISSARQKKLRYDSASPMLCGAPGPEDVITERNVFSDEEPQLNLF